MSAVVYRRADAAHDIEARYRAALEQWPVDRTEINVPTREGSTFVIACGPSSAPPVILLHGSQANSAAWMPDVERLSQTFRLYAIDMIGEPGLSAPVRPDLATDAHALWLDDVLARLSVLRAAFVGTSLGGWLALDYARRRPERVSALALICPAGIGRQKNFVMKALPLLLLGPWGQRKIQEMVFGPRPEKLPESLQPFAGLMEAIAKSVRPRVLSIPQLSDAQLGSLSMPLLAIVGGRDVLLDSDDTRMRLNAHVTHAEVCFIEDGYHFLPEQTQRLASFLERTKGLFENAETSKN